MGHVLGGVEAGLSQKLTERAAHRARGEAVAMRDDASRSLIQLRSEGAVVKHRFRREDVPNRPGVIQHVHDVEDCVLCALLEIAEAALDIGTPRRCESEGCTEPWCACVKRLEDALRPWGDE